VAIAPHGYGATSELRFVGGKLQQKHTSGNDPGQNVWVNVPGQ
jgi:hypothetical protein